MSELKTVFITIVKAKYKTLIIGVFVIGRTSDLYFIFHSKDNWMWDVKSSEKQKHKVLQSSVSHWMNMPHTLAVVGVTLVTSVLFAGSYVII